MTDPHIEMGRKISAAREAFCDLPQDLTRFDRTGMVDGFDPEFKPQRQMEQVGLPDARPNQSLVPDEES